MPLKPLKETWITPESRVRHPIQLVKEMIRDLLASRELAWQLLVRDIKAQYRQSVLGFFWAFVPSIVTTVALLVAKDVGAINVGKTSIPYPAYVMFSMALWQTFVEALNGPVAAVGEAKPMLAKINFPREALILAKIAEVLFNFGIKLILIVGLFLWFSIPISWTVILAPVALIHLIGLGTAIGLWLSPLGALYQDISRAIPLIMTPWLLLTPVIYPPPTTGWFSVLVNLNPVTPLLVTLRDLVTIGVVSDALGFWLASGLMLVLLISGWIFYRLAMPFVIERMSS